MNNPQSSDQLISFGYTNQSSNGFYAKNSNSAFENYNPNSSETSSPMKLNNVNDLVKDNIYLRGGGNFAEALSKQNSTGVPANSIA